MRHTQDIVLARLRELGRRRRAQVGVPPLAGAGDRIQDVELTMSTPSEGVPPPADAGDPIPSSEALDQVPDPVGWLDRPGPAPDRPGRSSDPSTTTWEPATATDQRPGRTDPPRASADPAAPAAGPDLPPGGLGQGPTGRLPIPWGRLVGLLAAIALVGAAAAALWAAPRLVPPAPGAEGALAPRSPDIVPESSAAADPFAVATTPAPTTIVVHIAGQVRHPGVVRLPAGSRVVDAVEVAGGLARGGSVGGANLARVLVDGERVEVGPEVPTAGPGAPGAEGGSGPGGEAGGLVDLNTATAEQLDALPGVGPVTAAKILAWRSQHGRFTVVDELAEVSGIGPKTLEELRPHVRV